MGCDRTPEDNQESESQMSDNRKQQGKPQHQQAKSKMHWLRLAKEQRRHAFENKSKCDKKGDTYGVQVYTVRIKALDLYIKNLQNSEA